MAVDLAGYLSSGEGSPRLWVNFNEYAKMLLLGDDGNPWVTPASYLAYYTQAHSLVKADVVVLDVWDLFHHWMEDDVSAVSSMAEKTRATFASKTLLEAYAPRALLAEVLTAIDNNYGNSAPIVLVIPSPRALLVKAHKRATGNNLQPDEIAVDTTAMYMADFLRYFSETNLSGILLVEDQNFMPSSTEEISWYQPVLNVAKHYRWAVGLQLPFLDDGFSAPVGIDFTVIPEQSTASAESLGVDITRSLWVNGSIQKPKGFVYLSIPTDVTPEKVLETLSLLKR
jgi:hypothetical protein